MAESPRPRLVANPDALREFPGRPLGRDDKLEELRPSFLKVPLAGWPLHAWVHGPAGTGKTFCVSHLLTQAARRRGCRSLYVNCRDRFTFLAVIEAMLDRWRPLRQQIRTREAQTAVLRQELKDVRAVVVLDEIDVLPRSEAGELLYLLTGLPLVSVIAIALSRHALVELPEPVRSRFAPRQIRFDPYDRGMLLEILIATVRHAMMPGTWTTEALAEIAAHANGDARRMFALLRHAIQRAEEKGSTVLRPDHLQAVNHEHQVLSTEEHLERLSSHHRLLVELVETHRLVPGPLLEDYYRRTCGGRGIDPVATRTLGNYLATLCQLGLLSRERGAGTSGWVYRAPG